MSHLKRFGLNYFRCNKFAAWCFSLLFLLFVIGCSGTKTESIEGSVTFDGQPVKAGTVTFLPKSDDGQQSKVHPTVANIVDGKFKLPQSMGIAMQKYRVVVIGYDGVPVEFSPEGSVIFREYNFEHIFQSSKEPLEIVVPESLKIAQPKKR